MDQSSNNHFYRFLFIMILIPIILPINDINKIIIGIASITYFSIYVNKLYNKTKILKNHPILYVKYMTM